MRFAVGLCLLAIVCSAAPAALAQSDVVTIGAATRTGVLTFDVPVYVRDVSGTPLGIDQPSGSRIQSYSIKVNYTPSAAVQSITFTRAGITAPLTPIIELTPAAPGSVSLLDTFSEATNLIPFTSNAAAPGNLIGHLVITFSPSATAGTIVSLNLDPVLTQLTDEGGTPATKETAGAGNLTLVNSSVTMPADIPAFDPRVVALLVVVLALVAVKLRA